MSPGGIWLRPQRVTQSFLRASGIADLKPDFAEVVPWFKLIRIYPDRFFECGDGFFLPALPRQCQSELSPELWIVPGLGEGLSQGRLRFGMFSGRCEAERHFLNNLLPAGIMAKGSLIHRNRRSA
jgi:hypothetical protein